MFQVGLQSLEISEKLSNFILCGTSCIGNTVVSTGESMDLLSCLLELSVEGFNLVQESGLNFGLLSLKLLFSLIDDLDNIIDHVESTDQRSSVILLDKSLSRISAKQLMPFNDINVLGLESLGVSSHNLLKSLSVLDKIFGLGGSDIQSILDLLDLLDDLLRLVGENILGDFGEDL